MWAGTCCMHVASDGFIRAYTVRTADVSSLQCPNVKLERAMQIHSACCSLLAQNCSCGGVTPPFWPSPFEAHEKDRHGHRRTDTDGQTGTQTERHRQTDMPTNTTKQTRQRHTNTNKTNRQTSQRRGKEQTTRKEERERERQIDRQTAKTH